MILVMGGTGMVGAHVLLACAKKKQSVRATYRREESLEKIRALFQKLAPEDPECFGRVEWVKTHLNDLFGLNLAFEGVTQVYHCAGKVSLAQYHKDKLNKTNIEGTANIVNLCLKHGVKKLGYVSSISALGVEKEVKVVNENQMWSTNQNHTAYAYSKYGAELEVWRGSQEGLNVIIINPGVILGAHFWGRSSGLLFQRIKSGLYFYPTGKTGVVSLEDVVKSIELLMDSKIKNERFILVSENIKQKILLDKIATALKKKKPFFPLWKGGLIFLFILEKTIDILGLKKNYLSLSLIDSLCGEQEYDGTKITKQVPFTYSDTNEAIVKIAEHY